MGRNYKNAFDDVKTLGRAGLTARSSDGRATVPWGKILAQFDTAA